MSDDFAVAWVAFTHDLCEFRVFSSEIACLRYAVQHGMQVGALSEGEGRENLLGIDDPRVVQA